MPKRGSDELLTTQTILPHHHLDLNGQSSVNALFNGSSALLAAALMSAESEAKKAKFECSVSNLQHSAAAVPCSSTTTFPSCYSSIGGGTVANQLPNALSPSTAASLIASLQQQQQLRALTNQTAGLNAAQLAYKPTLLSSTTLGHLEASGCKWLLNGLANGSTKTSGVSQKRDESSITRTVSKVVHLRNIPSDMTELELVHFCLPFGKLVNYLMLKGKNQAFVEYDEEGSAQSLVSVADACPMAIRGRTIFCQFSTHKELKTDRKAATKDGSIFGGDEMSASTSNLLVLSGNGATSSNMGNGINNSSAANLTSNNGSLTSAANSVSNHLLAADSVSITSATSQLDISGGTQQQPNQVLRVIIDNMIYPVTLEVLYAIFSRYGKVLRIITFNKNNTFQALVQLSEASAAQNARAGLDGQNVYNGCCTLRIDYSKLATLNVKYNNDKSRDYTNPNLPSGELTFEQQISLIAATAQGQLNAQAANSLNSMMPGAYTTFPMNMGSNGNGSSFYPQQSLHSANDVLSAAMAAAAANHQNSLNPFLSGLGASNLAAAAAGASAQNSAAMHFSQLGGLLMSPVVLVSNMDENKVTPDHLFTLFGVYGDVQRVKILFNKKDNALIQYSEAQQAQLAIQHLDKMRWHDKVIRVTASKHTNVQMPKEGQPDAGLTRDYMNSPLHRFKKPGSKNYMNIYPPSSTLHLSNIPPNITEEFLLAAFEEKGFSVKELKFFQRDHKMALAQLEDVESSINALVEMHNYKLADNAHLRVSFSKKGLKV